ncbi:MAG: general secretion pathway protein GspK [Candidatus Omnitrophica bacterium]|nr:general secretion pathway protein GspK [Candidatus Omnitrophota bacterium]
MNRTAMNSSPTRNQSEQAFVLIIILWISVGLVGAALFFGHSMMLEYRASINTLAGYQAEKIIEGALQYSFHILKNNEESGQMPDPADFASNWAVVDGGCFWLLGRNPSNTSNNDPYFGFIDESSKLNLNTATQEMLESLPNMTEELAAAIIDWRDEDSDETENGAESSAYQRQTVKYECKNAPFESIDELNLLKGASWNILYGEDANRNGLLDPNENDGDRSLPSDDQDGELDRGIIEFVTVFSREPNLNSESSERININENSADSSQTDAGASQGPPASSGPSAGQQGIAQELVDLLTEKFSEERAQEIQQALPTQGEFSSLLEFYIRSGMTAKEFAEIDDEISTSDDEYLEGLININTAPEEVLACIPGIGSENAAAVVQYRSSHSNSLDSIAWLAEVLEEEQAIQAGPFITVKSYQYTADIMAVGHQGKGFRRMQFVIDVSEDDPVVRYRRDLSRFGWALGREVRMDLHDLKESQEL